MGALAQIAGEMTMPDGATRQEWVSASSANKQIKADIQKQFGDDIFDKIAQSYAMKSENYQKWQSWIQQHPEIQQAEAMKQQAIISDPTLYKYYGSINMIQSYLEYENRAKIEKALGKDIYERVQEYYDLKQTDPSAAKQFYKTNKLWNYFDMYNAGNLEINKKIGEMMSDLPDAPEITNRAGEQLNPSYQQQAMEIMSDPSVSESLMYIVNDYYQGKELSDYAKLKIERLANKHDMTSDEVLQFLYYGLQQQ